MDMNEIATVALAARGSKVDDKTATVRLLRELMAADTEHDAAHWAPVYRYMISLTGAPPSAAAKNDAAWAWLAVGKKDVRWYLNSAYSDGKRLLGTDGHRLHIAKAIGRPAGYYDKAGAPVTVDGTFPDVDRITPRFDGELMASHTADLASLPAVEFSGRGRAHLSYDLPCGRRVNARYLKDALAGHPPGPFKYVALANDGGRAPIRIDYGQRTAVIMPLRK